MTLYVWTVIFVVLAKLLLIFGVKSVTLDFCKKSTFFVAFFCCNLAKTGLTRKIRTAMNS